MDAKAINQLNHDYLKDEPNIDINKFNVDFEKYISERNKIIRAKLDQKLADLNKPPPITPLYQLSVGQIIINTVDSLFDMMDDLIRRQFNTDLVLKSNRLFYIGVILITVAVLGFSYQFFKLDDQSNEHGVAQLSIRLIDSKKKN